MYSPMKVLVAVSWRMVAASEAVECTIQHTRRPSSHVGSSYSELLNIKINLFFSFCFLRVFE
jgi:hypothetical protein